MTNTPEMPDPRERWLQARIAELAETVARWERLQAESVLRFDERGCACRFPHPDEGDHSQPTVECVYHAEQRATIERLTAELATMRPFFTKHALGPKMPPSCLVCGQQAIRVAIQHLELPGIVVCENCALKPPPPRADR